MRKTSEKRMHVWKHNALRGSVQLALGVMNQVIVSESSNQKAKEIARDIAVMLRNLAEQLLVRIDPPKEPNP